MIFKINEKITPSQLFQTFTNEFNKQGIHQLIFRKHKEQGI
jgi:hypothetical protein